jgi:ketosteroid isomerase-like protein
VCAVAAINPEQVRAEVTRYWAAFTSKSPDLLEECYSTDATVFSSTAHRAEPGRLAATRRKREYFHAQTKVRVQLGYIEVQAIGEQAAVASYTFEFHASKVSGALGRAVEEDIEHGRATQVFVRDAEGHLRIVHEHFSAVNGAAAAHAAGAS